LLSFTLPKSPPPAFCPRCNKESVGQDICPYCNLDKTHGEQRLTEASLSNKKAAFDYALSKSNNFATLGLAGVIAYFALVASLLLPLYTAAPKLPIGATIALFFAYVFDSGLTALFVRYSLYTVMLSKVGHQMPVQAVVSELEYQVKTKSKLQDLSWKVSEKVGGNQFVAFGTAVVFWLLITAVLIFYYA
jgi:hypothetical protein